MKLLSSRLFSHCMGSLHIFLSICFLVDFKVSSLQCGSITPHLNGSSSPQVINSGEKHVEINSIDYVLEKYSVENGCEMIVTTCSCVQHFFGPREDSLNLTNVLSICCDCGGCTNARYTDKYQGTTCAVGYTENNCQHCKGDAIQLEATTGEANLTQIATLKSIVIKPMCSMTIYTLNGWQIDISAKRGGQIATDLNGGDGYKFVEYSCSCTFTATACENVNEYGECTDESSLAGY